MNPKKILCASHGTEGARAAEDQALGFCHSDVTLHHLIVVPDFWKGMMGDDWLNNAATQERLPLPHGCRDSIKQASSSTVDHSSSGIMSSMPTEDMAWVTIETPLSAWQLKAFIRDLERLFRINSLLEIERWEVLPNDRIAFEAFNLGNGKHLKSELNWSWLPLWRWSMQRVWQPMKPSARRITYWIVLITLAEMALVLLLVAILVIEQ